MTPVDVSVSQVVQRDYLKVDEAGTEAATRMTRRRLSHSRTSAASPTTR